MCEYLEASWGGKLLEAYSLGSKDLEAGKVAASMAPGDEQFRQIVSGAGKREAAEAAVAAAAKKAKVLSLYMYIFLCMSVSLCLSAQKATVTGVVRS